MNGLPLPSCPKHVPDGVDDGPIRCPRPAAFGTHLPVVFGQAFLEFPPQRARKVKVVHAPGCGSLSHKAHLLFPMWNVGEPILGEMRLCSRSMQKFSDRLLFSSPKRRWLQAGTRSQPFSGRSYLLRRAPIEPIVTAPAVSAHLEL